MNSFGKRLLMQCLVAVSLFSGSIVMSATPAWAATSSSGVQVIPPGTPIYAGETIGIIIPNFQLPQLPPTVKVYILMGSPTPDVQSNIEVTGTIIPSGSGYYYTELQFTLPSTPYLVPYSSVFFTIAHTNYASGDYPWLGTLPVGQLPELPVAGVLPVGLLLATATWLWNRHRRLQSN